MKWVAIYDESRNVWMIIEYTGDDMRKENSMVIATCTSVLQSNRLITALEDKYGVGIASRIERRDVHTAEGDVIDLNAAKCARCGDTREASIHGTSIGSITSGDVHTFEQPRSTRGAQPRS